MISALQHFRVDATKPDRITIWIDVAERSVNVLFEEVFDELELLIAETSKLGSSLPLVFRSAKRKGFIVGADLRRISAINTESEVQSFLLRGQTALDSLEQYKGDTIAAIQGPCLGGGFEFAMACRHRIACNKPSTQLGMPEAKLGLMPGWGGTQRLIEIAGVINGASILLSGEPVSALRAKEILLIDEVVEANSFEEGLSEFLHSFADRKRVPQRRVSRPECRPEANTESLHALERSRFGPLSPAQLAIYRAITTGIRESRVAGFRSERESFFALLQSPVVRENLLQFTRNRSA